MKQTEMTQEQFRSKIDEVAEKAVHYIKTDNGWYSMRDAFNELAEASGANRGIDHESTIGRRKLLVERICIACIRQLSTEANNHLQRQLNDIAEDYEQPRRSHGFRR